jgi:rRNA-processing protein FCF1
MMDPAKQLHAFRTRGVLIDSNLLLLLFLGTYDRRQIATNDRLSKYSEDDYDLLIQVLRPFTRIITTPNILTEVSNLSNAIPEKSREAYFASFAAGLTQLDEQHVASTTALKNRWARYGLTDAVIAVIAKDGYLVLTDDFRLSQSLDSDGIETLNFNHLRRV